MMRPIVRSSIEAHNEEAALGYLEAALSGLSDPRRAEGRRNPLRSVVVSELMAMVCGFNDAEAMACWSEVNQDRLAGFRDMPHGSPSQDVYLSVVGALEPTAFQAVSSRWAERVVRRCPCSDARPKS